MIEHIVELLTPNNCFICNNVGGLLCELCQEDEIEYSFRVCYSCAKRSDYYLTCGTCRKSGTKPTALYHVANYEGHAKSIVHQMKFSASREAARIIANQINNVLPSLEVDVVVPIPTATSRIRQRSFDHAKLIAYELAGLRGWRVEKLLKRRGQARQLGASKSKRRTQASESFELARQNKYPQSVLIVDDVISSGATIEFATKLLRKAGVRTVYAAVYARKL